MVGVHLGQYEGACDGPQSLDLEGIRSLVGELAQVAAAVGKTLA